MLAADGMPIRRSTLKRWLDENRDLYMRIRLELVPHFRAARAEHYRALSRRLAGTGRTENSKAKEAERNE